MPRHSKVQLQVLSLYKQFMRITKEQPGFQDYIRNEFKKNSTLARSDIVKVEYLLRRGWRQLDMLKTTSVKGAGVFEKESASAEKKSE